MLLNKFIPALLFWAVSLISYAQYTPGQLVRLPANLELNEAAVWIVVQPQTLDIERLPDRIIFAAPCQPTTIHIEFIGIKSGEGAPIIRQVTHRLTVGPVTPTPGPGPVTPEYTELAKAAKDAPNDPATKAKIVSALKTTAANVATYQTVDDMLNAIRQNLQSALTPETRQVWELWRMRVGVELSKLQLNSSMDLVNPLLTIVDQLK